MAKNDLHRIRYSFGNGGNLGKATNTERAWHRFRGDFVEVRRDTDITLAEYLALDDDGRAARKMGKWFCVGQHRGNKRSNDNALPRSMVALDQDDLTPEQFARLREETPPAHLRALRLHHPVAHPGASQGAPGGALRALGADRGVRGGHAPPRADALQGARGELGRLRRRVVPGIAVCVYPSASRDQEFVSWKNEGEIVCPDVLLDSFEGDWTDYTQLPYSEKRGQMRPTAQGHRAERPREKKGVIGAWCRAFDVEHVIAKHLSDVYAPGTHAWGKPRYTYLPGSGSNGAVVEDGGNFLSSNHSSDPVGERLTNSFDLLRVHKYGHLDGGKRADTAPTNLPSFKEMQAFAMDFGEVRREVLRDRVDTSAFEDVETERPDAGGEHDHSDLLGPPPEEEDADEWKEDLDISEKGGLRASEHNARLILENVSVFRGLGHDTFAHRLAVREPFLCPGANLGQEPVPEGGREWRDSEEIVVRMALTAPPRQGGWGMKFSVGDISAAVEHTGRLRPFNPVMEKLLSVK